MRKISVAKDHPINYNTEGNTSGSGRKELKREVSDQKIHIKASLVDDKGIWRVRARVPDPLTGQVKQVSRTTGYRIADHTRRRAEQKMKEIVAELEKAANAEVIQDDPLFSETVKRWREHKAATLRESTMTAYDYNINKHILPRLGNLRTREITMYHIRKFYDDLLKTHKVKTVRKIHLIVSGAMEDAVVNRIRSDNPASHIKLPKAEKYTGAALSGGDLDKLLRYLDTAAEPIKTAMLLAVIAGLRREEVCGLRWQDVDLETETLHIQNTVVQNAGQIWELERTKTPKSNRLLSIGDYLSDHLRALKATQEAAGLVLDKVCRWPDGREVKPAYISHTQAKVMEACGVTRIRFHDLRHTAGTYLAKHATPKQAQAFLGHEDISTTMNIYVHADDEDRAAAANIMDGLIKKSLSCAEICAENDNT